MVDLDYRRTGSAELFRNAELRDGTQTGAIVVTTPGPGIAEPNRGKETQIRFVRPAVDGGDFDEDVFRTRFGILRKHIEIAIAVEHPRVEQFEFEIPAASQAVLFYEPGVGKLLLRILVESFHVGVRGS